MFTWISGPHWGSPTGRGACVSAREACEDDEGSNAATSKTHKPGSSAGTSETRFLSGIRMSYPKVNAILSRAMEMRPSLRTIRKVHQYPPHACCPRAQQH